MPLSQWHLRAPRLDGLRTCHRGCCQYGTQFGCSRRTPKVSALSMPVSATSRLYPASHCRRGPRAIICPASDPMREGAQRRQLAEAPSNRLASLPCDVTGGPNRSGLSGRNHGGSGRQPSEPLFCSSAPISAAALRLTPYCKFPFQTPRTRCSGRLLEVKTSCTALRERRLFGLLACPRATHRRLHAEPTWSRFHATELARGSPELFQKCRPLICCASGVSITSFRL